MSRRSRGLVWLLVLAMVPSTGCKKEDPEEEPVDGTEQGPTSGGGIGASADGALSTDLGGTDIGSMATDYTGADDGAMSTDLTWTDPSSPVACPYLQLVGLPKVAAAKESPHAVTGHFRASYTATRGEYEIFDPGDGEYPDLRATMSWTFFGIPDQLEIGKTFDVTATGVCKIEPDQSWGPGEASWAVLTANALTVDNTAAKTGLCAGRSNATTGTGEMTASAFWRIQVPPYTRSATIAIADSGRMGTIATYEYACPGQ
jgi:hypothetical protein